MCDYEFASLGCARHAGMQPHASLPDNFHLTVFMTSQPGDPRADPFILGGGIDPSHPPVPIPAPTKAILQQEIDVCRQIALIDVPAFEVQPCELLFPEVYVKCADCILAQAQHGLTEFMHPYRQSQCHTLFSLAEKVAFDVHCFRTADLDHGINQACSNSASCHSLLRRPSPSAVLQVHSVVFANSGTLLLCLVDTTGKLAGMRQKIREAFPGEHDKKFYSRIVLFSTSQS